MADIARRANVHVTTVSLALRDSPNLPANTRQRLRALAEEMGYKPDPSFRALAAYRRQSSGRKNSLTIAYITHWTSEWSWKRATAHHDFFRGAEKRARELGIQLEHFWLGDPKYAGVDFTQVLESHGIRAIILASHHRELDRPPPVDWSRFSAVKIDYFPRTPGLHLVSNDQRAVIKLAVERVHAAGYRRIGFVMHRGWDHSVEHWWSAGFFAAQQRIPVEDRVPILFFPEAEPIDAWMGEKTDVRVAPPMLHEWLAEHRPDAIISKASFVMHALGALKMRVPDDIGFADVFLEKPDGAVAGVQQNHAAVGAAAVQFVAGQWLQQECGEPATPLATCVEGSWFAGRTLPVIAPVSA